MRVQPQRAGVATTPETDRQERGVSHGCEERSGETSGGSLVKSGAQAGGFAGGLRVYESQSHCRCCARVRLQSLRPGLSWWAADVAWCTKIHVLATLSAAAMP